MIGVYGKSGSGKTHSALLLARGLAGPDGKIGIIDTERRRSSACVGLIPGGFKRINLEAPFTPECYSEAVAKFEDETFACGVIDSLTHEWDGEGGVLEMQEEELDRMAGDNFGKREACKMAAWIKPKMRHKLLIKHVLRSKIPLICCLRGDEKTHVEKGENGKSLVITDKFSTPIYDKRFIFEMLVNLETVQSEDRRPGCAYVTKWTHPDILKCLPKEGEQITVEHGAALARWCADKGTPGTHNEEAADTKKLKQELWNLTKAIHKGNTQVLEQWLWDEMCMDPMWILAELDAERVAMVLRKAKIKIKP